MDNRKNLQEVITQIPLPMFTLNREGKVEEANALIGDVFLYDGIEGAGAFQLTGIKYETYLEAEKEGGKLLLDRNDKTFELTVKRINGEDEENFLLCVYFVDISNFVGAKKLYEDEKTCMAIINIDNFDELSSNTEEDQQMAMVSEIDKVIRGWGSSLEASVTKFRDNMYFMVFDYMYCKKEMEAKFPILDEVRQIETEADFPVTLSIGIGVNGNNLQENDDFADHALDLALGRGGDQVVIKDGDKISYFGGKAQTVEKGNKGKSRIIGHALQQLIKTSSKIFIMGHKNPDMDAFGAALGVYRLSEPLNRETYIVLDSYTEAITNLYLEVREQDEHQIINNKKAVSMIDKEALVIVVDTHRPSMTECPDLLSLANKSVVIDHHRKGEEFLINPTLTYAEPYASSTCELVTEILQYTIDRKDVTKLEAEALMSGIFLDTNRFSVKTGVRTLEAAAWLRRAGADPAAVKRLFQVDKDILVLRSKSISEACFDERGIAYAIVSGENPNAQIINSQVADQMLTIRGINYSFVSGKDDNGQTVISARSIGEKNVQVIMETFGGGGHLNTAGAQTDISPEEAIEEIKKLVEEQLQDNEVN